MKTRLIIILIYVLLTIYRGGDKLFAVSEPDTVHLQEVTITGRKAPAIYSDLSRIVTVIDKKEILNFPVQSLSGILEYAISVDVRERGAMGVQADLNMRGGSFEQVLILLNGVKMNDPQTGHHHLNLPVDMNDIERIEILEGPGSRLFGPYAYAGAVNIITKSNKENILDFSLTGGQFDYINASVNAKLSTGKFSHGLSFSRKSSNGYTDNTDFKISNIFYHATRSSDEIYTDFQAGFLQKEFGANSFYTPLYPEQFEAVKSFFTSLNNTVGQRIKFRHNVYFRRHDDRFELFRYEAAPWYNGHNYHQTNVYGTEGTFTIPWKFGTTAIGSEFRSENIYSNILGMPMNDTIWIDKADNAFYSKYGKRNNVSFFGEHNFYLDKINFSAGLLSNYNSNFGWSFFPGFDFSYEWSERIKTYFSFNQSVRMPSFTDLYYVGPTNLGNPDLKPETARNYEVGIKYSDSGLSGQALVFYRKGLNIIDWVRIVDSLKWESKNITELETLGFDLKLRYNFTERNIFNLEQLSFGYSWLNITKQSGNYISYYALDQLKHKVSISFQHSIFKNLKVSWFVNFQERNGSYTQFPSGLETAFKPFLTVDSKIIYQFRQTRLFVEASNLFDKSYIDFGNIPQPGRWLRIGLSGRLL
jgi:vitamin B12 transporter